MTTVTLPDDLAQLMEKEAPWIVPPLCIAEVAYVLQSRHGSAVGTEGEPPYPAMTSACSPNLCTQGVVALSAVKSGMPRVRARVM